MFSKSKPCTPSTAKGPKCRPSSFQSHSAGGFYQSILVLLAVFFTVGITGCEAKPVTFDAPLKVEFIPGETNTNLGKTESIFVPGDDLEYLKNIAKIIIPAYNERRKLTQDEGQKLAKLGREIDAKDAKNEASLATAYATYYSDWTQTMGQQSAVNMGSNKVTLLAGAIRHLILGKVEAEFPSAMDFNYALASALDKDEIRCLVAFNEQVLKMKIKRPDMSAWPVVFLKDFKVHGYQGSQDTLTLTLAVPGPLFVRGHHKTTAGSR